MIGIGSRRHGKTIARPPVSVREHSHSFRNDIMKIQSRLREFEQKNRKLVGWAHDLRDKDLGQ